MYIVYSIAYPYNKDQVIHENEFNTETEARMFAYELENNLGRITMVVNREEM